MATGDDARIASGVLVANDEGHTAPGVHCYVGLGSNLGESANTLRSALDRIARLPDTRLLSVSCFYRSAPVDATGPDFVNAVAALSTALAPRMLLSALHSIELDAGRTRAFLNAPRTLDLDLLLYGDQVIDEPGLIVPHPRMHERAFVLVPLFALSPSLNIPGKGPVPLLLGAVRDQQCEPLDCLTP